MPRILISLVLIGLSCILGTIFIWPYYQKLNNIQIRIENKGQEIQYRANYYEELVSISQKLEEGKEELAKIDSALSPAPPLPSLLKFFQKAASENGLLLTGAIFSPVKPLLEKNHIKQIQASLRLAGSYSSLKSFLTTLENSARLIEVDNISFSATQEEEEGPSEIFNFDLTIRARAY